MKMTILILFILSVSLTHAAAATERRERGVPHIPEGSILRFEEDMELFSEETIEIGQVVIESSWFGLNEIVLYCELQNRTRRDQSIPAGKTFDLTLVEVRSVPQIDPRDPLVDGYVSYFFDGFLQLNCFSVLELPGDQGYYSFERADTKFYHVQELLNQKKIKFEINPAPVSQEAKASETLEIEVP